jgi:amino acid adenylation domain-containing protein
MQLAPEDLTFLEKFNNTKQNFPQNKTIIDLFLEQVKRVPENTSVIFENRKLSYTELDRISSQFAHYLIKEHHIAEGDFIGLMIERSEWVIISILAILKTGSAYVPIDIEYPEQRKSYIQKDSNCKLTLDASTIEKFLTKKEKYTSTFSSKENIVPNSLIYIIYTSGTTGNPKGVMVEHRSAINLIASQTQLFGITDLERILQFSNYFFDASVEQFFLALLNGATLIIISKNELKHHTLPSFINKNHITHLHATPSYLETVTGLSDSKTLKRIIAGGERCTLKLATRLGKICDFYNEYGPTETTVTSTVYKYSSKDKTQNTLSIGKPIGNTKAYILSDNLELMPIGEVGELCIAGDGVTRGYLNLPELTTDKFINNPFKANEKLYRTGDYAKWRPDGNLEYIGRKDEQIKIRGYRVELGEIEAAINALPLVKRASVVLSNYNLKEGRLVAYIQSVNTEQDTKTIREQLSKILPEYMVPSLFIWVDNFPTTSNGKVDKKNLPEPNYIRPNSAPILRKPRNQSEKNIAKIWSEQLGVPEIGIDDNFFEMGGTSILTQKVSTLLSQRLSLDITVTKIYQYPTICALSDFLNLSTINESKNHPKQKKDKQKTGDIAIIGMAGRFPGARTIDELWEVLKNGEETISFFSEEELDTSIPEELRNDPLYVRARGIVPSAKEFDAKFFGLSPKIASAMDPQHRLFLEISWEVLEKSGHLPKHYNGKVGVYAGSGTNSYYINNIITNADLLQQIGKFPATTLNDKDYVATRTAYHLNLKGPAVSVHSACSTSSLAIAQAVDAIRNGQCDVALAGGSSITSPMYSGHLYQEGSILTPTGHCRPFDSEAKGTVFSDGAGVILLKSLDDAKEDGDFIHGVIKGVGVNNDGANKGSFTAPSVEGQADAINSALEDANVTPKEISYIEAHGTATPLGDPIEIEGLLSVFGKQNNKKSCTIGSIKSNMGHLTAAAGVAGVIKTVLAMQHEEIPPSIGFENPNPNIDFEKTPFSVNNKLSKWSSNDSKKAGVSSFGVGGTNVHIVVEEYQNKKVPKDSGRPLQILAWSAKSEKSLDGYQKALGNHLELHPEQSLPDIAYSLNKTRAIFSHRSFTVATVNKEANQKLFSQEKKVVKTKILKAVPNDLVFLFPGQGAQYLQMGKALYEKEAVFRKAIDECAKILKEDLKLDILPIIYPEKNLENAVDVLKDTQFTQPALFVIEYALVQLWLSWGIKPTALCGHSIGEFVAAQVAGVLSLTDALQLITIRGRLVSKLPGGSMLSIRTTQEKLDSLLPESLSIAAINSDGLFVVSGRDNEISSFSDKLKELSIPNKALATSHAFHSTMMNPVLNEFKAQVEKVVLNIPKIPIVSTVTGKWLKDSEATDPNYWTNHLRDTVRFSHSMNTILELDEPVLLEVGPGVALTTLSRQKKEKKPMASIPSLPIPKENQNAYNSILEALGELWLNGIEPDWDAFYKKQSRQIVTLPSYVFDSKPCWVEPPVKETIIAHTVNQTHSIIQEPIKNQVNNNQEVMRKDTILQKISEIIANTSGIDIETDEYDYNFLELGLDSLVLTQMAISCKNEFNTPITFRELSNEYSSPNFLAEYLDQTLPKEMYAPESITNEPSPTTAVHISTTPIAQQIQTNPINQNLSLSLISQQLQILGKQIDLLQGSNTTATPPSKPNNAPKPSIIPITNLTEEEKKEHKKPFGASPKIENQATSLTSSQQAFLEKLIISYNKKTASSKDYTQKHRAHMSDPRVVTGFKPFTKELVYPIVVKKSSGNRLWDLDNNEYLDTLNGFGSCLFGHQPEFIKEALHKQVDLGFEVGPQHPLAGEVCELLCEFTGHDRAALCNTGSEAVLGAMRIARTVTGRSLIVAFSRSYHGINDEVVVRGSKKLRTFPAASGIMPEAVQNMLILDYGTDESLKIIKERAHELAAVLVEPVQSRRPEFQPIDFLKEVRAVTKSSDTVLIFDEIITGFRMHPGGAQALFDIKADVATYGKVIGGGISIGAIVGEKKYMDALDGGFWQYNDDSFPEIGVTYFAGTFVRHPLALATTKASLLHMKSKGAQLQEKLTEFTTHLATELNTGFKARKLPMEIAFYKSLWRLKLLEEIPYSELLFVLMREKGIHIWDGFPCYMTEAYNEKDIQHLIETFLKCIDEMIAVGIFTGGQDSNTISTNNPYNSKALNNPPIPGARLGIDKEGNPAWFIVDNKKEGEYVKIEL